MLKLRPIGIRNYSVLEGHQRIGRIRFAGERLPGVWLWNVVVHLTAGLRRVVRTGTSLPSSSFATFVDGEARNDLHALR